MKILIVQLYTPNIKDIGLASKNNVKLYCDKYGYHYKCYIDTLDPNRHPAWSKIRAIQESLNEDYDWIWWLDADAFISNYSIVLEDIINEYSNFDIIFTDQKYRWNVNSGSMIVKNCEFSKNFYIDVYNNHRVNPYKKECCWEQDSINKLLMGGCDVKKNSTYTIDSKYRNNVIVVDNHKFNSVFNPHTNCDHLRTYNDGDFVIHFAGPVTLEQIKNKLMEIGIWQFCL